MFGLLPHSIASNARIVASIGQIGLGDPQEGPIWGHLIRVFNSQGLAIFEPCDLGRWVACGVALQLGSLSLRHLDHFLQVFIFNAGRNQDLYTEVPPCLPSLIAGQARIEASVLLLCLGHLQHPATCQEIGALSGADWLSFLKPLDCWGRDPCSFTEQCEGAV